MSKILDFKILSINRNSQRICKCNPPTYCIDTTNRLIQCTKCNAYIQPFDAMLRIAEIGEELNKEIKRLKEQRNTYADEVAALFNKKIKLNHFRNMQSKYFSGMLPICPKCEKPFDPTKVTRYTNKGLCEVPDGER